MTTKALTEETIDQSVSYLNHSFHEACEQFRKSHKNAGNSKGDLLYTYQVEFNYLIDNIQRDPRFLASQYIADANQLIAALKNED